MVSEAGQKVFRTNNKTTGPSNARAEYNRLYWARNPHRRWLHGYVQRCAGYGLTPVVEPFTKEELLDRWGDMCADCGNEWNQLDHRVPVAAGGAHSLANCCPICESCNRAKYLAFDRKRIADFRADRGCGHTVSGNSAAGGTWKTSPFDGSDRQTANVASGRAKASLNSR